MKLIFSVSLIFSSIIFMGWLVQTDSYERVETLNNWTLKFNGNSSIGHISVVAILPTHDGGLYYDGNELRINDSAISVQCRNNQLEIIFTNHNFYPTKKDGLGYYKEYYDPHSPHFLWRELYGRYMVNTFNVLEMLEYLKKHEGGTLDVYFHGIYGPDKLSFYLDDIYKVSEKFISPCNW